MVICVSSGGISDSSFGALASFDFVWALADLTMAIMALINLYAITKLYKIVHVVLRDYREQRRAGKDPVFNREILDDPSGVEFWEPGQVKGKE